MTTGAGGGGGGYCEAVRGIAAAAAVAGVCDGGCCDELK